MRKLIGFDNQMYLDTQSARIRERIEQFGGKLYLEFGGKLFDDYHASRVLPGFAGWRGFSVNSCAPSFAVTGSSTVFSTMRRATAG